MSIDSQVIAEMILWISVYFSDTEFMGLDEY